MPITEILEKNANLYGNDVSLVEINPEAADNQDKTWREYELVEATHTDKYRTEITWNEFNAKSNRFARLLIDRGVKKGDKVAILLMNCIEWLPIYFGILKTGAIVVPMNYRYTSDEILYCSKLAEVSVLVFGPEFIGRIENLSGMLPRIHSLLFVGHDCPSFADSYYNLVKDKSAENINIKLTDDDDAAIYFSSGTTGFPKAILHAHRSLMCSCKTENSNHKQTKDDTFLCIPPLYHTGAKMHWFGSFIVGGKGVLLKGTKPQWILKTAAQEKCTIVWLLVPWAQDILDAIERGDVDLNDYDLSAWRLMHIGAQPVPPSLIKRWKKVFPAHSYDTNYGLSESIGPGCVHLGMENIHKVGAIGIPGEGWQVRIIDENGNDVRQGDVGELAVKGDGVMKCYYHDEKATAASLHDGWLYTGDMARIDEDGFIYLVDRKKDVIITGGENLYPVQIEDFIRTNDAVKDVAVIGMPDARLGEIAAAIIELKPDRNCSEEEMAEFCNALPRYKRPRKYIFADVPRNPTGKIEKPKLRLKYCGESLVEAQIKG